jgi:hypothetical protein
MAVTTEQAINIIREELIYFLPNLKTQKEQLENFLKSIQPEIDQALASGDKMSLGFLRDRMIGRTGRVSLGLIHRQRVQVQTIVMTCIRTLVAMALL